MVNYFLNKFLILIKKFLKKVVTPLITFMMICLLSRVNLKISRINIHTLMDDWWQIFEITCIVYLQIREPLHLSLSIAQPIDGASLS